MQMQARSQACRAAIAVLATLLSPHAAAQEDYTGTCWVAFTTAVANGPMGNFFPVGPEQLSTTFQTPLAAAEAAAQRGLERAAGVQCGVNMPDGSMRNDHIAGYRIRPDIRQPAWGPPYFSFQYVVEWVSADGSTCYGGLGTMMGAVDASVYPSYFPLFAHPYAPVCGSYKIQILNQGGMPETNTVVTSVDPRSSAELSARVYNQNNQLVPNVNIELRLSAVPNSAGHRHGDNTVVERTGRLSSDASGAMVSDGGRTLTGNTGAGGFSFRYRSPDVSGDIDINATCIGRACTQEGPKQVWVGVQGLEPIIPASDPATGPLYVLLGSNDFHPRNNYLRPAAIGRLQRLAYLYRQGFPTDPPLYLNDASLERGGMFDIGAPNGSFWQAPHPTHRKGGEIDIRANPQVNPNTAMPEVNFADFEDYVDRMGGTFCGGNGLNIAYAGQAKQHYHLCLMGGNCCNGGN